MAVTSLAATRAYAATARLSERTGSTASEGAGDGNFGALLNASLHSVVDAGRKADTASQKFLTGKTDIVYVVTAVADLQTTFDTMVAIRDRVVSAYEDIMKMPI